MCCLLSICSAFFWNLSGSSWFITPCLRNLFPMCCRCLFGVFGITVYLQSAILVFNDFMWMAGGQTWLPATLWHFIYMIHDWHDWHEMHQYNCCTTGHDVEVPSTEVPSWGGSGPMSSQPTVDASRHIETHQDINSLRFRISMCFVIYFVSFISFISFSWFMMNCKIDHHIPMDHSRSLMLTYIHHVFHKKTSCRYFLNHVLKAEPSLNQRAQCFSGPG